MTSQLVPSLPLEEDYYKVLGCNERSTIEQISTEYRLKAFQFHPDRNPNDEAAAKKFLLVQDAKKVLLDEEMRKKYDGWRASGMLVTWSQWIALQARAHTAMHWAPLKRTPPALTEGEAGVLEKKGRDGTETFLPSSLKQFRKTNSQALSKFRSYQN